MPSNNKIYAIYDACSTLSGELTYIAKKLLGRSNCGLCDISHGWNPVGKAAWRDGRGMVSEVEWLHIDQQPATLSLYTQGRLPCVILAKYEDFSMLLNAGDLRRCQGDIAVFEAALLDALVDLDACIF